MARRCAGRTHRGGRGRHHRPLGHRLAARRVHHYPRQRGEIWSPVLMTVTTDLSLNGVRLLFAAEIDRGVETGVQISVAYRGEVIDIATGDNGGGHPMSVDPYVPWTCSSKPIGALAFAA